MEDRAIRCNRNIETSCLSNNAAFWLEVTTVHSHTVADDRHANLAIHFMLEWVCTQFELFPMIWQLLQVCTLSHFCTPCTSGCPTRVLHSTLSCVNDRYCCSYWCFSREDYHGHGSSTMNKVSEQTCQPLATWLHNSLHQCSWTLVTQRPSLENSQKQYAKLSQNLLQCQFGHSKLQLPSMDAPKGIF